MPAKSKRVVPRSKLPTDATLMRVQGALRQNVDYFLQNINVIVKKYTEYMSKATSPTVGAVQLRADPDEKDPKAKDNVYVSFPDNRNLIAQLQTIKKEAYELSTTYDGVYDWIVLNLPDLKEEDTTGTEIMSAVLEQISSLNEAVNGIYNLELKYYEERAEMEKAILKMPECRTLQLTLTVGDEDTWLQVDKAWRVMIRSCLILYAMLSKNMDRLTEPTGKSRGAHAYYQ